MTENEDILLKDECRWGDEGHTPWTGDEELGIPAKRGDDHKVDIPEKHKYRSIFNEE